MKEKWVDIIGYEGLYKISNYGNVSSSRSGNGGQQEWCVMSIKSRSDSYACVVLSKDKKRKHFLVHRLVACHFIQKTDGKEYVNHKDSNPSNNTVSNLEWCTLSENIQHSKKVGALSKMHISNYCNKRTTKPSDVIHMRALYLNGISSAKIAEEYGISQVAVWKIVTKKSFRWI